MKHMKEVTYQKEYVSKITCDLCGEDVKRGFDSYEVDTCTVKRVHGDRYPEGDFTSTQEVDLCGKCFEEVVIEAVKAHGGVMREFDTDGY